MLFAEYKPFLNVDWDLQILPFTTLDRLMKIRMSSPDLTDADREAVNQVVQTPNLSMGPNIDAFERAFCDLTGAKHAIGVNSGTAGLHLLSGRQISG